jgi:hypothetical protein
MDVWKRNIFVNAIKARMERENKTKEELIAEYTKLTEDEKTEVKAEIK